MYKDNVIAILDDRIKQLRADLARVTTQRDKLLAVCEDATERMTRARSILQDPRCGGEPSANWGMLDAGNIRAAIAEVKGK